MIRSFLLGGALLLWAITAAAQGCGDSGAFVQVLGSGGPQLQNGRASNSFIVWINGRARILVDIGGGAALRFGESHARIADLDAILFTQLDAGHSAGLPALIDASRYARRTAPLPVYGPGASRTIPSTITFVRALFDGTHGAYRGLGEFLSPLGHTVYKLKPHEIIAKWDIAKPVMVGDHLQVFAAPLALTPAPTLAWRINANGKSVVFVGDMSEKVLVLKTLAANADLLIVSAGAGENAPTGGTRAKLALQSIGRFAAASHAQRLVLTELGSHTQANEEQALTALDASYNGRVQFVNDLQCLRF